MRGKLLLEDGTVFHGSSFAYEGKEGKKDLAVSIGEVVFNTAMSGYQEILTDPSYSHQLVAMTYPLIGNYGVNQEDLESDKIHLEGLIVREYQPNFSNYRATKSLADFLIEHQIPAIEGIDTRKLTRHIREKGALRGILAIGEWDNKALLDHVLASPKMEGLNLAAKVSCEKPYLYQDKVSNPGFHIAAMDLGIKTNILRMFAQRNCSVTVVPSDITPQEILKLGVDAVFLSNGPGDPAAVKNAIETVRSLLNQKPIFGICLGHQILSIALGAKTYKLKFGHHGGNHPVFNKLTETIEITSQNHGFAVDESNLPDDLEITHTNLNDGTVEGMRHKKLPVFSVQYHPESSPGPQDSAYLFDQFIDIIKQHKK